MGGWRDGLMGGRRERVMGEYRFCSLVKLKKKEKNYAVFYYFAGKRNIFIYIYDVITWGKKSSAIHYCSIHMSRAYCTSMGPTTISSPARKLSCEANEPRYPLKLVSWKNLPICHNIIYCTLNNYNAYILYFARQKSRGGP
jgi:hypothetical protein